MPRARPVDHAATHRAQAAAQRAAEQAGVVVRELEGVEELREASVTLKGIWGMVQAPFGVEVLRGMREAGNYLGGAFRGEQLVGASVAFLGYRHGELLLHSQITGVTPATQGRQAGFALKQFQRAWALGRGIGTIVWTFDPLVRRNAYFNLTKLGALGVEYFVDFYGPMDDELNTDEESDRCLARWELLAEQPAVAAQGGGAEPDVNALRERVPVILAEDPAGRPWTPGGRGEVLLAQVPADILALRQSDPGAARGWRTALRDTFGEAIAAGYVATGMSRDGWYVLEREGGGA